MNRAREISITVIWVKSRHTHNASIILKYFYITQITTTPLGTYRY
jgi:hypothetical protein